MAECFPEKSSWCRNEQVCRGWSYKPCIRIWSPLLWLYCTCLNANCCHCVHMRLSPATVFAIFIMPYNIIFYILFIYNYYWYLIFKKIIINILYFFLWIILRWTIKLFYYYYYYCCVDTTPWCCQGYLYKKSNKPLNKEWKKKYVTLLDDGRFSYFPSLHVGGASLAFNPIELS